MMSPDRVSNLPDDVVLAETKRLTQREQAATADVLVMLAEVDSRKLYFVAGYGSLFSYCTDELHLSEDAAYTRIEVARVSRAFPMVLELVAAGALSLTNARLLAPALTPDNHVEALRSACHRRKRDVELLLARLRPQPDVVTMIRKLPAKSRPGTNALFQATLSGSSARQTATAPQPGSGMTAPVASTPSPRPVLAPLSPERFKVQFTADQETHDLVRRAQALARHRIPSGDLAAIFKLALRSLVSELERTKAGLASNPRAAKPARRGSRYIPRSIRRAIWERDGARCAFEGPRGRCQETEFLEFHHLRPFAHGGHTAIDNMELRCRAHNVLEHQMMIEG